MASRILSSSLARFSLAAALLGATACNNDPGSGTLTIQYEFGIGGSSCSAEGVNSLRITLGDEQYDEPCDDSEVTFSNLPARNYSNFIVEGLDLEGITVRDNLDAPDDDEAVEVIGGSSQVIDVRLTPTPATIEVTFILLDADGVPYVPSADIPVETITVEAAAGTNVSFLTHEFDISALAMARNVVPDPERDIEGDRVDTVVVEYEAGMGSVRIDGDPATDGVQPFTFEPPGFGRLVQITVTCNGDVCEGELMGTDAPATTGGGDSADDTGVATSG